MFLVKIEQVTSWLLQRASHESKKLIKLQTIVSDVLSIIGLDHNRISKRNPTKFHNLILHLINLHLMKMALNLLILDIMLRFPLNTFLSICDFNSTCIFFRKRAGSAGQAGTSKCVFTTDRNPWTGSDQTTIGPME